LIISYPGIRIRERNFFGEKYLFSLFWRNIPSLGNEEKIALG